MIEQHRLVVNSFSGICHCKPITCGTLWLSHNFLETTWWFFVIYLMFANSLSCAFWDSLPRMYKSWFKLSNCKYKLSLVMHLGVDWYTRYFYFEELGNTYWSIKFFIQPILICRALFWWSDEKLIFKPNSLSDYYVENLLCYDFKWFIFSE